MNAAFWNGRSVLVTGGTGLLGGWMVQALVERDSRVVVLVRDSVPNSLFSLMGLADRVTVVQGSLSDPDVLRRVLAEYGVQTVFHLAAQSQVRVAKTDPVGTLEANVRGTWNLLDAARLCGGVDVIAASSDKAYGESDTMPYREDHPLRGRYPYDVSKSCMDLICGMYAASFGLPVVVTRCANLYGGGDYNFDRLIPGVIRSTLLNERFVIRSDGEFVRDYLYVEDAVSGYLTVAEHLSGDRDLKGEAFNFGADERHKVIDVVTRILDSLGRADLSPIVLGQASSEIREQYLGAEKARTRLGWRARVSFDDGLKRTADWYRNFLRVGANRIEVAAGTGA